MAREKFIVQAKASGNQSNAQIVAAVTGKIIVIDRFICTLSAQGTVALINKEATSNITPAFNLPVDGPLVLSGFEELQSVVSNGIGITTTGGGDCAYILEYHTEP